MLTTIRGVAAGSLVLIGIAGIFLGPLFLALGSEKLLLAGTLEFNTIWTGMTLVVSLLAASAAGWTAHRVSGGLASVVALAGLVTVFGLADAGLHHWLMPELSLSREGLSGVDILVGLREPLWYDLSGPIMMAMFIWVAGASRHTETTGTASAGHRSV